MSLDGKEEAKLTERTICPTCFGVGSYYIDWDKPNEHDSIECHRCKGSGEVEYVRKVYEIEGSIKSNAMTAMLNRSMEHINQSGREAIGVESSPVPEQGCCGAKRDTGGCGCS